MLGPVGIISSYRGFFYFVHLPLKYLIVALFFTFRVSKQHCIPTSPSISSHPALFLLKTMTLLTLTKVLALAIILLPLVAIQNKATDPSSIVSALPAATVNKHLLSKSEAPLADTIDGAHILLQNDVDSATDKHSFLLLSKPRNYMNAAQACQDMFDCKFRQIVQ